MSMDRINQNLSLMATRVSAGSSSAAQRLTSTPITKTAARGKESLKDSICLVSGGTGGGNPEGGLWAVMMDYQKMTNKEAREDRQLSRQDARLELTLKEGKLGLQTDKIKAMREEAGERFDHAMAAAGREMVMGVASSVAAVGVVAAAMEVGSKTLSTAWVQSIAEDKNWGDKQTKAEKKSDKIATKIGDNEIRIARAGVTASDSKEASESARDRKKSGMDSIQKFLDILRSMNPQI